MYGIQTKASNTYRELLEEEEISAPSFSAEPSVSLVGWECRHRPSQGADFLRNVRECECMMGLVSATTCLRDWFLLARRRSTVQVGTTARTWRPAQSKPRVCLSTAGTAPSPFPGVNEMAEMIHPESRR